MILFVYNKLSNFVRDDLYFFQSIDKVESFQFNQSKHKLNMIKLFFDQFLWLLKNIKKSDAIFVWFADYHSFLPTLFAKLFKKKVFIVIGGYDVNWFPEFNYGYNTSLLRRWATLFSLKNSTSNLTVAKKLAELGQKISRTSNFITIPTGYSEKLIPKTKIKRDYVLTVADVSQKNRYYIKGMDRYFEIAKKLPQFTFYIVGTSKDLILSIQKDIPNNVKIMGKVPFKELIKHYQEAKIYLQLSRSEGLPNALCEAMLADCVPIGTDVGGIEEVIGTTGITLKKFNIDKLAENLINIMNNKLTFEENPRKRILNNFSSYKREKALKNLLF